MPQRGTGKSAGGKKRVKQTQSDKENQGKSTKAPQRPGRKVSVSRVESERSEKPREMPGVKSKQWRPQGQAEVAAVKENVPTNVEGAATGRAQVAKKKKYQPPAKKDDRVLQIMALTCPETMSLTMTTMSMTMTIRGAGMT